MTVSASFPGASSTALASGEAPVRIVFIGAGPSAAMLVERVSAAQRSMNPELRLDIRVIDPFPPGGGRIWRKDQSPLLKLNSMLEDVAFFTDDSCELGSPVEPGPTLAEWVRLVRERKIAVPEWQDTTLTAEIAEIDERDFPTRRLNNAYLSWCFTEVQRRAAEGTRISWTQGLAVSVRQNTDTYISAATGVAAEHTGGFTITLRSGEQLSADLVVYALGHNGSLESSETSATAEFAARHGLDYVAPAFTADIDLDWIAGGEEVIVRGMGLAAIDLMVLLTEGRGGEFSRTSDGSLRYAPSGREPVLHLGSRRGVPYRSKVSSTLVGDPVRLEYLSDELLARLEERADPLDFDSDIWPLIQAELITGYYRELFTGHPERVKGDWQSFAPLLREALRTEGGSAAASLQTLVRSHVPEYEDRFDLDAFVRPLAFTSGTRTRQAELFEVSPGSEDAGAVQQRVVQHIGEDLRLRTEQAHSATQALFLTALYCYAFVAEIPAARWNAFSLTEVLPKRWHSFFSYLASGPPGHRLEELIALADAGIVRFLGGDVSVRLDEQQGAFIASGSAEVGGAAARADVRADVLIDAWLPEAQAARSDNPLLRYLVEAGHASELTVVDAEYAGSTGQLESNIDGSLPNAPGQFAVGPFTSKAVFGAFTRPGMNSLPFRVFDRAARAILAEAVVTTESRALSERAVPRR